MPETLLGIDFASPNHTSGYALVDATGALLDVGLVGDDAAILDLVDRSAPRIVAIDCPLGPKKLFASQCGNSRGIRLGFTSISTRMPEVFPPVGRSHPIALQCLTWPRPA